MVEFMNEVLKQKADLMVNNYNVLKSNFKWDTNLFKHFGAMVYATKDKRIDAERLEEVKRFINDETSWTSYFRGTNKFIIASLLSLEENYGEFFRRMTEVYERMKDKGLKRSVQLPTAAYTITKEVPKDQWDEKIDRMIQFYDKMKENHFWITSADDYVFAAVLGSTDLNVSETTYNMERCYNYLNNEGFYKGNYLQTLSHILAIGEETVEEKCSKAVKLHNRLKEQGCKLQYHGMATLGLLALVTSDVDSMVRDIKEVYDYINSKDGYGFWSLDKNMRTMLAASIVSDFYVDEAKRGVMQVALGNSITAIIIAQQQAAVAAACAASAAAASSSSS
jgi:hypothetical protein